jgi:transcriptional regulator with XRE-family HTH domain
MEKSLFSGGYKVFLSHLRATRKEAGFTQTELAKRLRETQSFVSKCERGERRLDLIEARAFCRAMDVSFLEFTTILDHELERRGSKQVRPKA